MSSSGRWARQVNRHPRIRKSSRQGRARRRGPHAWNCQETPLTHELHLPHLADRGVDQVLDEVLEVSPGLASRWSLPIRADSALRCRSRSRPRSLSSALLSERRRRCSSRTRSNPRSPGNTPTTRQPASTTAQSRGSRAAARPLLRRRPVRTISCFVSALDFFARHDAICG